MMVSTKGRYALRVMIDLAEHQKEGFISLRDVAERQEISMKYMEAIVAVLNQLLIRSGREDQAMMTTLAGLVVVLSMLVQQISDLFVTIKALFAL